MEKDLMKDAREASVLLWKKAVKKIPAKYKALAGAGLFAFFSQTANASPNVPTTDRHDAATEAKSPDNRKDIGRKTIRFVEAGGKYNGRDMKFAEMEAPDLGHLFESGMDPYVMGDNQYLGLYQMDIGATMKTFLFGLEGNKKDMWPGIAKDYPLLVALGKTEDARRSENFRTMFGDLSKTKDFREKMDAYMRIVKYEPVYAALRKIPDLDFDNRGKVFLATVMSAANQNSTPKVIAGIYDEALKRAKVAAAKQKRNVTTADIIEKSYDVRKEKWKLDNRYKEECRLALDWQKYEEVMTTIKLAREEYQKTSAKLRETLKRERPPAPISSLSVIKSPISKFIKISPQTVKRVIEKKGRQ